MSYQKTALSISFVLSILLTPVTANAMFAQDDVAGPSAPRVRVQLQLEQAPYTDERRIIPLAQMPEEGAKELAQAALTVLSQHTTPHHRKLLRKCYDWLRDNGVNVPDTQTVSEYDFQGDDAIFASSKTYVSAKIGRLDAPKAWAFLQFFQTDWNKKVQEISEKGKRKASEERRAAFSAVFTAEQFDRIEPFWEQLQALEKAYATAQQACNQILLENLKGKSEAGLRQWIQNLSTATQSRPIPGVNPDIIKQLTAAAGVGSGTDEDITVPAQVDK